MTEVEKLEQAIQALESQRGTLGSAVVETALVPLLEKLNSLQKAAGVDQAQSDALSQQRKLATVLFADMPGFTAMSETMDAEDLRETMNALWKKLDAAIITHGGRIDKHMGDGVMAIWGGDETREDDPERAIHAALAMQKECEVFEPPRKLTAHQIKMRIGINTGIVLLGSIGARSEFTAMGDVVNVAARLEQSAPAGSILIAHDTYRHVRGVFDVSVQPPLEVKGKSEPLQTYLVTAAKARAFRLQTRGVEGIETRMIGRNVQMQKLQTAFQKMTDDKNVQMITVVGDAGIGKSRLLYEFHAWSEVQSVTWWQFQGRSTASMVNSPYALLRDIISFRYDIRESDPLWLAHEKLELGMKAMLPDDPAITEKAHFIGHLVGFDYSQSRHLRNILADPKQIRERALVFFAQILVSISRDSPVLFMLDDLHWADIASLDALTNIFSNVAPESPIMVVALSRPTLFERYKQWSEALPNHLRIDLQPLSKGESRVLVNEILQKVDKIPTMIQELIVGGAEGNPYYVEELIKMMIDGKVFQPRNDKWEIDATRLAELRIPPTLTEVLQARLDSLPALERTVLQRASILGRIFWDDGIVNSDDLSKDKVKEILRDLQAKELIFQRSTSAFDNTYEYIFKHNLLHEVAYETVLKRQRGQLHIAAAQWLERISGERRENYLAMIAEHYERAGEFEKSAQLFLSAGKRAFELSAFPEARNFYEHALLLITNRVDNPLDQVSTIHLNLAQAFTQLGDYANAQIHAEAAWSTATELGADVEIADAQGLLGEIYSYLGEYERARSYLIGALYLMRQHKEDKAILGRVLVGLAGVEWRLGNLPEALDYGNASLTLAKALNDNATIMLALNRVGVIKGAMGNNDEEEQCYQESLNLALNLGNRERASVALNNLGALAGERQQWQKAWDYYIQALALTRETGSNQSLALHQVNLGFAGIYLNKLAEARVYLRDGITLAIKIGAIPVVISGMTYMGVLKHAEGEVDFALEIMGACKAHPIADSETEREIKYITSTWNQAEEHLEASFAKGAQRNFDELVQTLVL